MPGEPMPADQEQPPRQPLLNAPPVTVALCLMMVAGYAVTTFFGWGNVTAAYLVFDASAFRGQFGGGGFSFSSTFALIGHAFVHSGFGHFAANTLFLLAFGSAVERALGGRTLAIIFVVSAIAGAVAMALHVGDEPALLVGASGGVHGVAGAAALTMIGFGRGPVRRTGVVLLGFLIIVNLLLALAGGGYGLLGFQIGWQAHLGGLATGLAIARWSIRRSALRKPN